MRNIESLINSIQALQELLINLNEASLSSTNSRNVNILTIPSKRCQLQYIYSHQNISHFQFTKINTTALLMISDLSIHYILTGYYQPIIFIGNNTNMKVILFLLSILLISSASTINKPVSLAVTIYNDQFAMVKDVREISFDEGNSDLYFTDVSSNIQTETVTFKAVNATDSVKVYEQNYEANLINTYSILQKYIDKSVDIYAKFGQQTKRVNGILLGYNNGYILKTNYGIEVLNNIEGITFSSLPEGYFTLPTLNWKVNSAKAITTNCEVAYRTTGFSWKSDYSITLNQLQTKADIGGWVTIDNHSGKKYQDAKLKLIAGDVNTVQQNTPTPVYKDVPRIKMTMTMTQYDAAPSFSEKSFSDYHLYTLSAPVTLNDNSQKQVEFIPKVYNIAVRKYNFISISVGGHAERSLKAGNKVEITNSIKNKLGIPLPKGTVRVFKTDDSDGSLEFIGEDSISHTPKDENITIKTGNAFDITAEKIVTNYRSYSSIGYSARYTADLNLTISNHKSIFAEIVVELNNYYGDSVMFTWTTLGLNIQRVSANLLRIKRVFAPDETVSYLWNQDKIL